MDQGVPKGIELGLLQGQGAKRSACSVDEAPVWPALAPAIEARVHDADSEQLDEWCEHILDARDLTNVFFRRAAPLIAAEPTGDRGQGSAAISR